MNIDLDDITKKYPGIHIYIGVNLYNKTDNEWQIGMTMPILTGPLANGRNSITESVHINDYYSIDEALQDLYSKVIQQADAKEGQF